MAYVTSYDSDKMETVQRFFDNSSCTTKAYAKIRDLGIEPCSSYKKVAGSRGRGSKLYSVTDLDRVRKEIAEESKAIQTEKPKGALTFDDISTEYETERHILSALFKFAGFKPDGSFKSGSNRPTMYFDSDKVKKLMAYLNGARDLV